MNSPVEATSCSASSPPETMTFTQGVCGSGKLDFYVDEQSYTYDYFISGGDRQSQGICRRNDGRDPKECIVGGLGFVEGIL